MQPKTVNLKVTLKALGFYTTVFFVLAAEIVKQVATKSMNCQRPAPHLMTFLYWIIGGGQLQRHTLLLTGMIVSKTLVGPCIVKHSVTTAWSLHAHRHVL
jgi:hypothetical protein